MSAHWPASAGESSGQDPEAAGRTCNLWYIRRELGRQNYQARRMLGYIRLLIAEQGFPAPLPTMVKRELTVDATADSLWLKAAVDDWLDRFLPPPAAERIAAATDAAAHAAAAAEMDAAAGNLRLIAGGRA